MRNKAKKKKSFKMGMCVAPVGLTLPNAKKRLVSIPKSMRRKNPEHIMMKLWAKENVRDRTMNFGLVPIDGILHQCNEKCGEGVTLAGTPGHHYLVPNDNDVRIINATIQWLATNGGQAFLREFRQEVKHQNNNSEKPNINIRFPAFTENAKQH